MVAQKEHSPSTTQEILQTHLEDRYWRINNLYYIRNEQGVKTQFVMNDVQELLYRNMWWKNIIPKSRQHGITTFVAIFFLDRCLFNSNKRAGIIAHKFVVFPHDAIDDARQACRLGHAATGIGQGMDLLLLAHHAPAP